MLSLLLVSGCTMRSVAPPQTLAASLGSSPTGYVAIGDPRDVNELAASPPQQQDAGLSDVPVLALNARQLTDELAAYPIRAENDPMLRRACELRSQDGGLDLLRDGSSLCTDPPREMLGALSLAVGERRIPLQVVNQRCHFDAVRWDSNASSRIVFTARTHNGRVVLQSMNESGEITTTLPLDASRHPDGALEILLGGLDLDVDGLPELASIVPVFSEDRTDTEVTLVRPTNGPVPQPIPFFPGRRATPVAAALRVRVPVDEATAERLLLVNAWPLPIPRLSALSANQRVIEEIQSDGDSGANFASSPFVQVWRSATSSVFAIGTPGIDRASFFETLSVTRQLARTRRAEPVAFPHNGASCGDVMAAWPVNAERGRMVMNCTVDPDERWFELVFFRTSEQGVEFEFRRRMTSLEGSLFKLLPPLGHCGDQRHPGAMVMTAPFERVPCPRCRGPRRVRVYELIESERPALLAEIDVPRQEGLIVHSFRRDDGDDQLLLMVVSERRKRTQIHAYRSSADPALPRLRLEWSRTFPFAVLQVASAGVADNRPPTRFD